MRTTQDGNWAGEKGHKKGHKNVPFWVLDGFAKISASALERMAGTTRLELATSAVTALRELVLQQLTRPRGLPKYPQVVQDIIFCGLGCGLEKLWVDPQFLHH